MERVNDALDMAPRFGSGPEVDEFRAAVRRNPFGPESMLEAQRKNLKTWPRNIRYFEGYGYAFNIAFKIALKFVDIMESRMKPGGISWERSVLTPYLLKLRGFGRNPEVERFQLDPTDLRLRQNKMRQKVPAAFLFLLCLLLMLVSRLLFLLFRCIIASLGRALCFLIYFVDCCLYGQMGGWWAGMSLVRLLSFLLFILVKICRRFLFR